MTREQLLSCALDIGEQMLISGAEVGRVESTVKYICTAYGYPRTDVFTITSCIIASVTDDSGLHSTQTRRIMSSQTDLTKLHRLNGLSREICKDTPDYDYVQEKLKTILKWRPYPLFIEALGSALIGFSFAVFFGGSWMDGLVSGVLGFGIRYLTWLLQKGALNQIFVNVVASFLLSVCAISLVRWGVGDDINKIIIGDIMLLIPGIALTNSLRDMISGETMTGILRFLNAVLVAAAIAAGYIVAVHLIGGVL